MVKCIIFVKPMTKFDFTQDLKIALHSEFSDYGITIPIKANLDAMLYDYLTIHKKLVKLKPRTVIFSPTLQNKLVTHPKKKEIEHIASLIEQGKDINYFQSKKLFQARFHDHLLYEWNIFHFHLSFERENKSAFFKQTDILLFIYITDNEAIFLDSEKHLPGIFGDVKWLEILHDYFPEKIAEHQYSKLNEEEAQRIALEPQMTAVQRQQSWDDGLTIGMTLVRDMVYFSPGIGRSTSGHSILVGKTANEILRWLHTINTQFGEHFEYICSKINVPSNKANFKLHFGSRTLEIIETTTQQIILTYRDIVNIPT